MLKFLRKHWFVIVTSITLFLLAIALTPKTLQNDTYYLIKIGDDILSNGLDFRDHYAWTADLAYTYPHFLYNIFLALIFNGFGFFGIYISNICLFIVLLCSLFYILSKTIKHRSLLFVTLVVIAIAIAEYITARSQLVSYILLVWEVYALRQLYQTGKTKHLIYLVVSSWLIAMTHAIIWPFVFILYLPFICEHLYAKLLNNKSLNIKGFVGKLSYNKSPYLKKIFLALGLSIAVGLLTPSRICFTAFIRIALGDSQSFIQEHQMLVLLSAGDIFVFVLLLTFFIFIITKTKARVSDLCLYCGITFMAFYANRNLAFFFLFCIPLLAELLEQTFLVIDSKFFEPFKQPLLKKICPASLILVISVVIICGAYKNFQSPIHDQEYACEGAVVYIKENLNIENIRLYNPYNIGSYLLFNDIPVFIDSRANIYTPQFNGEKDILADERLVSDGNYAEVVERYQITHLLVYKDSTIGKILDKDTEYSEIYSDEIFALYVKN